MFYLVGYSTPLTSLWLVLLFAVKRKKSDGKNSKSKVKVTLFATKKKVKIIDWINWNNL